MKITPEYLKTISDEEIAKLMVSSNDYSALLAAQESQRRDRLHQHELDIKLMERQVRWMKFSAIIGVAGTLSGVYLGTYLDRSSPQLQQPISKIQVQQQISSSSATHHIKTNVSSAQMATVLKTVSSVSPSKRSSKH